MRAVTVFVFTLICATVNMDVQLSGVRVLHGRQRTAPVNCNTNYDEIVMKRITLMSKYIFTGKVYGVEFDYNDTRTYKVTIRRVLKGDLNDVSAVVRFGAASALRFSGATVLVENSRRFACPPLRLRTYAIFLMEKRRGTGKPWLDLVVEPVPLILRNLDMIEAAIKVPGDVTSLEGEKGEDELGEVRRRQSRLRHEKLRFQRPARRLTESRILVVYIICVILALCKLK